MNPPTDKTSLVGLLECVDGTAAVIGKRHQIVESKMPKFKTSDMYGSVRLTREAGEALYELLGEWLGKDDQALPSLALAGQGEQKG